MADRVLTLSVITALAMASFFIVTLGTTSDISSGLNPTASFCIDAEQ